MHHFHSLLSEGKSGSDQPAKLLHYALYVKFPQNFHGTEHIRTTGIQAIMRSVCTQLR